MKIHTKLECQTILIFCIGVITAENDFDNKLTNIWSIPADPNSEASRIDSSAVEIQPTSYRDRYVPIRASKVAHEFKTYVFRPRMIPLNINKATQDNTYNSQNIGQNKKSDLLFPGNYLPIAEVRSNENETEEVNYNPIGAGTFKPMTIPIVREQESIKRSLNNEEIISKNTLKDEYDSKRSLSYIFGAEDDEEEESDGDDYETEDNLEKKGSGGKGGKGGKKRKKYKMKTSYSKYMTPLLLAYKLKYFALIPVLISGLILLVGATGLAGFFFALFAAVMGLQKGGDY